MEPPVDSRTRLGAWDTAGRLVETCSPTCSARRSRSTRGKLQPFAEGLFGGAHSNAYGTILKARGDLVNGSGSNNGFAMEWGGGLDWAVAKNVQVRPVEADYLYTHFGSTHVVGYSASQNNFKYVTGVNFTFGSK